MKRIQRKRAKGWRMPENTIYVGRGSKWGNPFRVIGRSHDDYQDAVDIFEEMVTMRTLDAYPDVSEIIACLRGKNLACWCQHDMPCHADILLKIANKELKNED